MGRCPSIFYPSLPLKTPFAHCRNRSITTRPTFSWRVGHEPVVPSLVNLKHDTSLAAVFVRPTGESIKTLRICLCR
jgi:hypothetical protein